MEQVAGIEPVSAAWEATILPMNYTCTFEIQIAFIVTQAKPKCKNKIFYSQARSSTKGGPLHRMRWQERQSNCARGGITMSERVVPGPVQECGGIREAVCIHTKKIYDSCREEDIPLSIIPAACRKVCMNTLGQSLNRSFLSAHIFCSKVKTPEALLSAQLPCL